MARIFEAPNVVHVCVRPPNVSKDKRIWGLTSDGTPFFGVREVDLARREGSPVFVFDEGSPPASARLLPIPYNKLECPARISPPKSRVVAAKEKAKEAEEKKDEPKKAERPKPLPRPIARAPERERCTAYREPGQTRLRSGTGPRTCTRVLVHRARTEQVVAENRPRPVEAPVPKDPSEVLPGEVWRYEDWRQTPEETERLERAYECLQGTCHARHQNFIPKDKKKPAGKHNGQSLSTGSGSAGGASSPQPAPKTTTVKTRTKPVSKPSGAKPNGVAAGQGSPANTGAAANERRVPNPNGKKGGPEHQAKVREIEEDIKKRGLTPEQEYPVPTPGGEKKRRYMDVVGKRGDEVVEMHQVGKQTRDGRPVARERKPLDEVERAKGLRPNYHSYNKQK
ncbi:hypothetical protein [Polyangium sp. 6x1]|uniref:hypothetical protein n=1 Tax=Polyangium sp. 6x1 TaxID=3042689 RepID=UPI0024828265|nr:hypothetical protein [Polyangium sp. 6x1]MDI1451563.1 hypothetical protein [Polyangium sp. 6x1]